MSLSDSDSDSDEEKLTVSDMSSEGPAHDGGEPPPKMAKISAVGQTAPGASGQPVYNKFAARMMAKMGYEEGKGLGKHAQGRVEIVKASTQRGRRGLGLRLAGLEPKEDATWEFEEVSVDEVIEWLPHCDDPVPELEELREWKTIGPKKRSQDGETNFCESEVLQAVESSKNVFDALEPEEMRRARTRSNPFETLRGVFFQNRAAVKMANMDAVLDFMFTQPKTQDEKPMVGPSDLLYFADICAGPGGFSEYILWRMKGEAKGFGMTLKGGNDFKLEDFFAGPSEMFEPHYGVDGKDGDGDIYRPDNQAEFIKFVKENTDGHGVHIVMADGGFSVEGQENIQEILSKQLYLCQLLVAMSILREGGHIVCKLFDLFTAFSVGLVYLMYRSFDSVCILKPVTSRPANSERYIICKGLRPNTDSVRHYMHEINLDLRKLMISTSKEDVNSIVPLHKLNSSAFFEYIHESNNRIGEDQVVHLKKIQMFAQNTHLYEDRQAEIRTQCLDNWKLPDEVRAPPGKVEPKTRFTKLVGDELIENFEQKVTELTSETLRSMKSVYDYRCIITGNQERERWYILGSGRSRVFKWDGRAEGKWKKMDDTDPKIELPSDTLIEAEVVYELKGEAQGQRRLVTLHVLDALFLFGQDMRHFHFNERLERLKKFVKCVTKKTRTELTPILVPEVYRFEDLGHVFDRLKMMKVKGGGGLPRLCYIPKDGHEGRYFRPTGVYFVKTVKDPWSVAFSRSQGRKYFYNGHTKQSTFECPRDSWASFSDSKQHSFHWWWEEGVKVHESQGQPDPVKVSRNNIIEFLRKHNIQA